MSGLLQVPILLLGLILAQGSLVVERLPHGLLDNVDGEGDDGWNTVPSSYQADLPSSADSGVLTVHNPIAENDPEQASSVTELANLVDKYDEHVFGASAKGQRAMQRFAVMSSEAVKAERRKSQKRLRDVMQVAQAETRRAEELGAALKEEHNKTESLTHQLHEEEAEKGKLKKTLSEAGSKIQTLSSNIVSVYKEARAKIQGFRKNLASKDKEVQAKEKEASNLLLEHKKEAKDLEDKAKKLSGELEASRSEAAAAESKAKALKASLDKYDSALRGQRLQSQKLQERWDGLKQETSDLTARLEALNRTRSREAAEQLREVKSLQSKLTAKEGELKEANQQKTAAAKMAASEQDNAAHAQEALKDLAGELQAVHAKLHAEEVKAETARREEASKLTGELNALRAKLHAQAAGASAADAKALDVLKSRVKSLAASLKGTQSELQALKSHEKGLKGQAEARAEKATEELARLKGAMEKDQQALRSRDQNLKEGMAAQGQAEARAENAAKEMARLRETIESERKARAAAELKMASQFNKKLAAEEKKASDLRRQFDLQHASEHKTRQLAPSDDSKPEAEHAVPQLLGDTAKLLEATSAEAQELVQDNERKMEHEANMEQRLQATEAELAKAKHMVQVRDAAIQRLGSALNESIEAQEATLDSSHATKQQSKLLPSKATLLESLQSDMQELKRLAPAEFEGMTRLFKVQQAHRQTLRKLAECRVSNHIEKTLAGMSKDQVVADSHSKAMMQELHRVVGELQALRGKVDSAARHIRRGNAALMKKVREFPGQHMATEFLQAGHESFKALADETAQHVSAVAEAVDRYNARAAEVSATQGRLHLQSFYSEVMLEMAALDGVSEKASSAARLLDYMRAAVGA